MRRGKEEDYRYDMNELKRRLNELREQNTQEDTQQLVNRCLLFGASAGQFEVCEYLLEEGGDPTWRNGCNVWVMFVS